MTVQKIRLTCAGLQLEGLLQVGTADRGMVISHPHPLYSGDMYNPVVAAVADVCGSKGWSTLRFNFRGVGGSQGRHDQGHGEQQDVLAAVSCLRRRMGIERIDLGGYSFGSWVNAAVSAADPDIGKQVMISPPVGMAGFDMPAVIPGLQLVVAGDRDEIAPIRKIRGLLPQWNPEARLEIIAGADHFYGGYLRQLRELLATCL